MGNLTGVKTGDTLMLIEPGRNRNRPARPVQVIKVARKLLTVQESPGSYGESVFRIESGVRNDGYGHSWLLTVAEWDAQEERTRLNGALREAGIEFERFGSEKLSLARLRALLAVMEDESL